MIAEEPVWTARTGGEAADRLRSEGLSPRLAALLAQRGIENSDSARSFLHPSMDQLHDPFLLAGMEAAVDRLEEAIDQEQIVVLVGDYDVDGVTATALLTAVFQSCGMEVRPILPHRIREGYGFQSVHVARAADLHASLIVTADCGTSSNEAALAARELGIDVLVTDHHIPGDLPSDVVQINPHQETCDYPFSDLCGAGLAFKLAVALCIRLGKEPPLEALLRIACLGTIADLVPLRGENRVIAALGLDALRNTRSVGLKALIQEARLRHPLSAEDVGFRIGPRINAAGRLHDAQPALDLLLTRDLQEGRRIAARLAGWNRDRQAEERKVVDEAREAIAALDPLPRILVAWSENWHRGVVGIAAGRLAREFHRPTILLAAQDSMATGSGRSIAGVDLHQFLSRWSERLERFGGHSQAIGLTVELARLDDLYRELKEEAADWPQDVLTRTIAYELEVAPAEIGRELLEELSSLEPHGKGNARPLLKVGPLELAGETKFFGKGHLKARAMGFDGGEVHLLGWRWQERAQDLVGRFEALGFLEEDSYLRQPVLRLEDARSCREDSADTAGPAA